MLPQVRVRRVDAVQHHLHVLPQVPQVLILVAQARDHLRRRSAAEEAGGKVLEELGDLDLDLPKLLQRLASERGRGPGHAGESARGRAARRAAAGGRARARRLGRVRRGGPRDRGVVPRGELRVLIPRARGARGGGHAPAALDHRHHVLPRAEAPLGERGLGGLQKLDDLALSIGHARLDVVRLARLQDRDLMGDGLVVHALAVLEELLLQGLLAGLEALGDPSGASHAVLQVADLLVVVCQHGLQPRDAVVHDGSVVPLLLQLEPVLGLLRDRAGLASLHLQPGELLLDLDKHQIAGLILGRVGPDGGLELIHAQGAERRV
mmetsp:Transcript_64599/g.203910  ORF Transcript_64599/g.203910 Transcript_64599/m.203910 type:complete len:322 (-) Transcript_64599:336-1301(-)